MRSPILTLLAATVLALAACSKPDPNSQGNGPGHADGLGGRADAPTAPAGEGSTSTPPADTASENVPPGDAQGEPGTPPAPTPAQ